MKIKRNIQFKIVVIIVLAFILYNMLWLGWRSLRYTRYTENLKTFSEFQSYVLTGEDGYFYNAKLPDYLSFTGNLCVATPDNKIGLILWPRIFNGYQYGVQIEENDEVYSIELDKDMNPINTDFTDLINANRDTILLLQEKAEDMWD